MAEVPLEQLYREFLERGDEAALEQWMRRSSPPLRQLARRLGASAEDAEDLVQETFVAAIQASDRYDATRPLLPWLKGILTFRAARLARDELRRRRHYEQHHRQSVGSHDVSPSSAAAAEDHHELHDDVRRAIDDLPERYREPLLHYLLAQRSPIEIAQQLGVERATIRTQLHRGMQQLRDALRRWAAPLLMLLIGRHASAATRRGAARTGASALAPRLTGLVIVVTFGIFAWRWLVPPTVLVPPTRSAEVAIATPSGDATHLEPSRMAPPSLSLHAAATNIDAALVVAVHDSDGKPLPHVGVRITPLAGLDPVLHQRQAVTDADGLAHFVKLPGDGLADLLTDSLVAGVDKPNETHRLDLRLLDLQLAVRLDRGPSLQLPALAAPPRGRRHTFSLDASRRTTGRVVDTAGNPVAGATIWLADDAEGGALHGQDVTQSDANGRFELLALPVGARLAARHPRLARGDVVQLDATHDDLQLSLGAIGGRVQVQLRDACDRPVCDALVFVGDDAAAASLVLAQGAAPQRFPASCGRSDREGVFVSAAIAAGPCPVFVRASGQTPFHTVVYVRTDDTAVCIVRLAPGAVINGAVQTADGTPLPLAFVAYRHADDTASVDLHCDGNARFVLDGLPAGEADLVAEAPGFAAAMRSLTLTNARQLPVRLVLHRARRVDGRISIAGRPAPAGTELRADWPPSALRPARAHPAIDDDGHFTFADGHEQLPMLSVRLPGEPLWRPVTPRWQDMRATIELPTWFAANSWLVGRVLGDNASALRDARLFLQVDGERWAEVGRSDIDGNYRLGPLPALTFRLLAETTSHNQPTLVGDAVQLPAHTTLAYDLVAAPTGVVDIRLVREDGGPVDDVLMTLQRRDLARRFAIAEAATLQQRLEAGEYVLSVMGRRVEWIDALPVHVTAGAETPVLVTLRTAIDCRLAVRGLPSGDGAMRELLLTDVLHPERAHRTFSLLPDAPPRLGAVLPEGRYALQWRDRDSTTLRGQFDVVASDTARTIAVDLLPTR